MINLIHTCKATCRSRSARLIIDNYSTSGIQQRPCACASPHVHVCARAGSYVHARVRQLRRATRARACIHNMNPYMPQSQGCIPTFEHRCTRQNISKKSTAQATWTLPLCISPDSCQTNNYDLPTWFLPTWFPLLRDTIAQDGTLELGARSRPLQPDCKRSRMVLDRSTPCTVHHTYTVNNVYAYDK